MAGKTAAERMRQYRQRLSEEKKQEISSKNAEQKREKRKQMSNAEKQKNRIASRKRMQKFRKTRQEVNNNEKDNEIQSAYGSVQALGKAIQRVKRALPKKYDQQKEIIQKLAIEFGFKLADKKRRSTSLPEETVSLVKSHYESDLISRQSAGMKDNIIVKDDNGNKLRLQKKILLMTLTEAYQQFKLEHPECKIGRSSYAKLRPKHIVPVSEKDHNVCCCRYHENAEMILDSLREFYPTQIPKSINEFIEGSTCNWKKSCFFEECPNCKDVQEYVLKISSRTTDEYDNDQPVYFYQWSEQNKKERIGTTLNKLREVLISQLSFLRIHHFTAKMQLKTIRFLKENISEDTAVLQIDFAENFGLKQQNEIMAAHWVNDSVTIYTAVFSTKLGTRSYAIISDNLSHDKFTVFSFNKLILLDALSEIPVKNVHIFSDGAGSQFKNRFTLSLTVLNPKILHPDLEYIDWNFFATAHGKGPVDGIGGSVKQAVWRRVLQQKVVVSSAEDFAKVASESCKNIKIIYISSEIMSSDKLFLEDTWLRTKPNIIKNTHKIHHVSRENDNSVKVRLLSPFLDELKNTEETKIAKIIQGKY